MHTYVCAYIYQLGSLFSFNLCIMLRITIGCLSVYVCVNKYVSMLMCVYVSVYCAVSSLPILLLQLCITIYIAAAAAATTTTMADTIVSTTTTPSVGITTDKSKSTYMTITKCIVISLLNTMNY